MLFPVVLQEGCGPRAHAGQTELTLIQYIFLMQTDASPRGPRTDASPRGPRCSTCLLFISTVQRRSCALQMGVGNSVEPVEHSGWLFLTKLEEGLP